MWATAEESRDYLIALYRRVWTHSDATIHALPLHATAEVAWWPPEHRNPTLHRLLVHMIAETHRHAGHADLVRELIDGAAGMRDDHSNLPPVDPDWWEEYYAKLEQVAEGFRPEAATGERPA